MRGQISIQPDVTSLTRIVHGTASRAVGRQVGEKVGQRYITSVLVDQSAFAQPAMPTAFGAGDFDHIAPIIGQPAGARHRSLDHALGNPFLPISSLLTGISDSRFRRFSNASQASSTISGIVPPSAS